MNKKKIRIYKRDSEIVLSANTNFITQPAQIQWKKEVFSKEELSKGKIRHVWQIADNGELIGEGPSIKYKFRKSDENKYVKFYAMVSKFQSIEQYEIFYVESEHDTDIFVKGVESDKEEVMIGEKITLTVEYSEPKRVSEKTKENVKWMVRIDSGTDERLIVDDTPVLGGEVSFTIPSEWEGTNVTFMPYLDKQKEIISQTIVIKVKPVVFFIGGAGDKKPFLGQGPSNIMSRLEYHFNRNIKGCYTVYLGYDELYPESDIKKYVLNEINTTITPIYIIGHSFGGWNAAHLCKRLIKMGYKTKMLITLDPVSGVNGAEFFVDLYHEIPLPIEADFWINISSIPEKRDPSDYVADIGAHWKPNKYHKPDIYFETKKSHAEARAMFEEIISDGKSAFDFIKEDINKNL